MSDIPAMTVLSLGAGVQSTTLALLAVAGQLPAPDAAIFADTGWEPERVYSHLDRLERVLRVVGIPLYRVTAGNLRNDSLDPNHRYCSIPYHVRNPDGSKGMGRRQCTSEYKLKPIKAKVRELLGYPHPKPVPRGLFVEQWIGFSTDEIHRVRNRSDVKYTRPRYPLIDLDMTRADCDRWLKEHGWATVGKSACIGCPYHGNRQWRELRDNFPDEWADAIEFDRQIRKGGSRGKPLRGEAFLHRSCVPLDIAPIDRVSRTDRHAERGDSDGCSPYGCRSGEAVQGGR